MNVDKASAKLAISCGEIETTYSADCAEMSDARSPSDRISLEGINNDVPQRALPIGLRRVDLVREDDQL